MKERIRNRFVTPHRTLKCNGFKSEPNPINSSNRKQYSLYTDLVIFFFSFFSKTSASPRERKINKYFLLSPPQPLPPCAGGFFNHARLTNFEEKIEGLWTGYKQYWHAAMCGVVHYHLLSKYLIKANLISTCIPDGRTTSSCLTQIEDTLESPYTSWGGRWGGGEATSHTFS